MFQNHAAFLLSSPSALVRTAAATFTSKWLPSTQDDGKLKGLAHLKEGLIKIKEGHWGLNDGESAIKTEFTVLSQYKKKEKKGLTLRRFLAEQLLLVPGTFVQLRPLRSSMDNVFFTETCDLPFTRAVAFSLNGLGERHRLVLYKKLDRLVGVPEGCTTTPYLITASFTHD